MSYKGYRFGVQYTNDGRAPSYWVKKSYRNYLSSLPPEVSVPLMEKTLDDINRHQDIYYASHNWYSPKPYSLSDLYSSRKPYKRRTHRPYYYV